METIQNQLRVQVIEALISAIDVGDKEMIQTLSLISHPIVLQISNK